MENDVTELYLDIETIPAQRPDVLEEIRASKQAELDAAIAAVKAPSNYGADAAAKWMADKGEAQKASLLAAFESDVDEAYRRTGLDGAYGQVCVIGYAINDCEAQYLKADDMSAAEERALLESFACVLTDLIPKSEWFSTTVIGHNVVAFDLRFLIQRHIVTGVRPHMIIARAAQAKPWEQEKVYDTLVQWAGPGAKAGGSMDRLCKALGIPSPKGAIDGSKVWDFVKDGRIAEVADYCARDVAATRALHRRMTFAA
jgi:3'-5' exonuclease